MNAPQPGYRDRVVITGIGLVASTGANRESLWASVRRGQSGARWLDKLPGIPDRRIIAAPVEMSGLLPGQLKVIALCQRAAHEALVDAWLDWPRIDRDRFACAISSHMADTGYVCERLGIADVPADGNAIPWWRQWWPNTACRDVANRYGLWGPRISHSTACASGLVDFLAAVRAIQDDQCDLVLTGSGEAVHPLLAAGFRQMGVLAYDDEPASAARPFAANRCGFIMGEGAAMLVVERLSHALSRGAGIYAEVLGFRLLADAHHMTDIDQTSAPLARLIGDVLARSRIATRQVDLICAHGTGTRQNDLAEARAIHAALGKAAHRVSVTAIKSSLGHLVNASGSVELALLALALRDGFVPPTINLHQLDPACDLDCTPLVGRPKSMEHGLKLAAAFGGHLAAVLLRRWDQPLKGTGGIRRAA